MAVVGCRSSMHTAGAVVCNSRHCYAVSGEVALPSYSDTCDLPVALGRRSPAGTITSGTWVRIRVRRLGPADGWERYRDRRAWPGGRGAGAVWRKPGSGPGPKWGAQAHGG